jgi:hypothetical protein
MNKEVLELPTNLRERRKLLEAELSKTVSEQISQELSKKLNETFDEFGIKGELAIISWEFHPESDDEGGTDWYPSYITLKVDGEDIDMEEIKINKKPNWSEKYFDFALDEEINDLVHEWSDDLHKHGVEELIVEIGE